MTKTGQTPNEQSIEGQLKVCYEFAERNGYKIIGEHVDRAKRKKEKAELEAQLAMEKIQRPLLKYE